MPKRYFTEGTSAQAGVISDELRNALGIREDSVPIWIHRMRVLGYPPGWLKKADMTNTTIKLFDGTENKSKPEEPGVTTYNPDSFIAYPGFNVPLPPNVYDNYEHLGMPPMLPFQQLKYAKKTILAVKPVPYKRIKLSDDNDKDDQKKSNKNKVDEEKIKTSKQIKKEPETPKPSKPTATVSKAPEPPLININQIKQEPISAKKQKPSIEENQEVQIKAEQNDPEITFMNIGAESTPAKIKLEPESLAHVSVHSLSPMPFDNTIEAEQKLEAPAEGDEKDKIASTPASPDQLADPVNESEVKLPETSSIGDFSGFLKENEDTAEENISNTSQSSKLTLISMGAPVPKSLNGIKPPLENFAVGMGELVYFENLPDSTGVFDKLRKVIKKIRRKIG